MTLWQTPNASQPTLRGRSVLPMSGRPVNGYVCEHEPGRWRE